MSIIGNPLVSTNYQTDTFNGNGSTVAFTLSVAPASAASIAVYISGLYQTPGSAYTITGTTLTFTGAPPTGTGNILVLHLGIKSSTLVPVDQSITPAMLNNANVIFWSMANTNVGIGNTAPGAPLTIGSASGTFTNPLFQAAGNANSWIQLNAQNLNNGNNASTDLVLARSDGNDTSGFIDMGINSNTYAQAAYSIMTPRSGYLFTNGGDLVLGTQTAHNILFHTGNTTSASQRAVIAANGNVGIANTTPGHTLAVGGTVNIQGAGYLRMTDQTGSGTSADYWIGRGGVGGASLAFYAPAPNVLEFGTNNNAYMSLGTNALSLLSTTAIYNNAGRPILRQSGSIIQVQSYTKTDAYISSGTSAWSTPTGFQVSITPTSTSSKIFITGYVSGAGQVNTFGRLRRDGTVIAVGDAAGSRTRATSGSWYYNGDSNTDKSMPFQFVDSPGTTSTITYDFQLATPEGASTFVVNRSINDSDIAGRDRSISTITVMEIAQ